MSRLNLGIVGRVGMCTSPFLRQGDSAWTDSLLGQHASGRASIRAEGWTSRSLPNIGSPAVASGFLQSGPRGEQGTNVQDLVKNLKI